MKFKILQIFIFLCLMTPFFSNAQVPFGGRILTSYECTCSGGWLIFMYDHVTQLPIPIVFEFGYSRLNKNFNIFTPGVSILGSYTPGGVCMMASTSCYPVPVVGTITSYPLPGIGTSLSPL